MNNEYWNKGYWKEHIENDDLNNIEDLWINNCEILENIQGKALDLGCGVGQYTKYLLDKGMDVVSGDISTEALSTLKEKIPEVKTIVLDMSKPLEFEDESFDLVFANLSIHFFNKETTINLIKEIKRILKKDGYFIGSVNSSKAYEFIKDHVVELEKDFYQSKERQVRLFTKEQFDEFFRDFKLISLEEVETIRFNKRKDMWKFIYKKD